MNPLVMSGGHNGGTISRWQCTTSVASARAYPGYPWYVLHFFWFCCAGVNVLLRRCPKLQVIHLNWCSGPLTPALLTDINVTLPDLPPQHSCRTSHDETEIAPQPTADKYDAPVTVMCQGHGVIGSSRLDAAGNGTPEPAGAESATPHIPSPQPSASSQPSASPLPIPTLRPAPLRRWALQELQICSSSCTLNDRDISTLIDGGVRYKPVATLHTLALVSCSKLSSMLLTHLAKHASTLKHLRIEDCGSYGRPTVSPTPTGTSSRDTGPTSCSNVSGSSRGSSMCGEGSSTVCGSYGRSNGSVCNDGSVGIPAVTPGRSGHTSQSQSQVLPCGGSDGVRGVDTRCAGPTSRQHVPTATYTREPFSETLLLKLLASCVGLKSLRLRHVCQVSHHIH